MLLGDDLVDGLGGVLDPFAHLVLGEDLEVFRDALATDHVKVDAATLVSELLGALRLALNGRFPHSRRLLTVMVLGILLEDLKLVAQVLLSKHNIQCLAPLVLQTHIMYIIFLLGRGYIWLKLHQMTLVLLPILTEWFMVGLIERPVRPTALQRLVRLR